MEIKNILIDKQINYLAKDEYNDLLKDYDKKFVVGKELKQRSFDENCAHYCKENNCDFLTADNTAYIHFFKIKSIKFVQISEFTYEKKADRPIYLVRILS